MGEQIMILGDTDTGRVRSALEEVGYQTCENLSVTMLEKSVCLVVSVSKFEKINQIIERIRLQVALPIVVVYRKLSLLEKQKLIQSGVAGFVHENLIDAALVEEISFARIRNEYANQNKKNVSVLKQKFEDRKLIDQAKGILIQQGLTEKEAYQLMRKTSMDQRLSLVKIAQAILVHEKMAEEDT